MKTTDVVLIVMIAGLLLFTTGIYSSFALIRILLGLCLMVYVCYIKLNPYAAKLSLELQKYFNPIKSFCDALTGFFSFVPKIQVGQGLMMDISQLVVMAILIILIII